MEIIKNKSLRELNTFGIEALALYYARFSKVSEIREALERLPAVPLMILGGGSNILLTKDFDGLVLHNAMTGHEAVKESEDHVWLKVMGGEFWHDTVMYAVEKGWGGIENLALIPGSVGAAPMQNIGAYGVEIRDVFHELEAYDLEKANVRTFSGEECKFGYRESFFKKEGKGKFIITSVTMRLNKTHAHQPKLHYSGIRDELKARKISEPSIADVADAVITIRNRKLPDPSEIGNSGSFFKNPVITKAHLRNLLVKYPQMVFYELDDRRVKVPAGWLIEYCGWKGKVIGNTGTYKNQALVLVNHGSAEGSEVRNLADRIKFSVLSHFGIALREEVNII